MSENQINNPLIERIAEKGYNMGCSEIAKKYALGDFTWENELDECKELWRNIAKMAIDEVSNG